MMMMMMEEESVALRGSLLREATQGDLLIELLAMKSYFHAMRERSIINCFSCKCN